MTKAQGGRDSPCQSPHNSLEGSTLEAQLSSLIPGVRTRNGSRDVQKNQKHEGTITFKTEVFCIGLEKANSHPGERSLQTFPLGLVRILVVRSDESK